MAQIQEIRVMFDTNSLYTGLGHRLINEKLQKYIIENKDRKDLSINFYIPSVVIEERRYQMKTKGLELLPSISKLENLLGHNLGINASILDSRVEEAIRREMKTYSLNEYVLNCANVNWNDAISLATQRMPPFEKGEKEKGFRDFIVAQSFLQICKESPTTPKICRLALVTSDSLLSEYVNSIISDRMNAKVIDSIESLNSFIETMASTIGEELLKEIQGKVSKLFWDFESKNGLWQDWGLYNKIYEKLNDEFQNKPEGTSLVEHNGSSLSLPRFNKKEKQIIHWITTLTIKKAAFTMDIPHLMSLSNLHVDKIMGAPTILNTNLDQFKRKTHEGEFIVDIHWHTTITTAKTIKNPKFDYFELRESKWDLIDN